MQGDWYVLYLCLLSFICYTFVMKLICSNVTIKIVTHFEGCLTVHLPHEIK